MFIKIKILGKLGKLPTCYFGILAKLDSVPNQCICMLKFFGLPPSIVLLSLVSWITLHPKTPFNLTTFVTL